MKNDQLLLNYDLKIYYDIYENALSFTAIIVFPAQIKDLENDKKRTKEISNNKI
jgi:hypothetical protein